MRLLTQTGGKRFLTDFSQDFCEIFDDHGNSEDFRCPRMVLDIGSLKKEFSSTFEFGPGRRMLKG